MRLWKALTRSRGDRRWDWFIRGTGIVGAGCIPVLLFFPNSAPLVWLIVIGIPSNGPLSPILPTLFDPLLVEVGKYAPTIWVAVTAVAIYMYMEFINWHIYSWVLNWEKLTPFRGNRTVRWGVNRFGRAPISTIVVFAITPMPFWVVRGLAILHHFSLKKFMVATAVGRFPRFYMYAWLGSAFSIPTWVILVVIVGGAVTAISIRLAKGQPLLADDLLDGKPQEPSTPGLTTDVPLSSQDGTAS